MAGSIIGALRAVLGLETAAFDKGIKDAQSALSRMAAKFAKPIAAVAVSAGVAAGAVALALKGAINRADELGKAAQKIGIPVEELSKLEFAAKLADVSFETLSVSAGKLAKAMSDIAGGDKTSDAARAFAALNIEVTNADGSMKSTTAVIGEVAEAFSRMEDGAGKTALAMAIFGRGGKEMIPLLNEGAAGLQRAADEAERFGLVVDQKTAKAAETFNDNMTRLQGAIQGLITQIAAHAAPVLAEFTNRFIEWVKEGSNARELADKIVNVIKFMAHSLTVAKAAWDDVAAGVRGFAEALSIVGEIGLKTKLTDIPAILKRANEAMAVDTEAIWKKAYDRIGEIWKNPPVSPGAREPNEAPSQVKPLNAAPIIQSAQSVAAATRQINESVRQGLQSWNSLVEEGRAVFEATRTPAEQLAAELERLQMLLNRGVIDWDTYSRAVRQAKDDLGDGANMMQEMGDAIGGTFKSIFSDLARGSANLKDSLKDLLGQLTDIALNSAFQGLFGGGGAGGGNFFSNLFGFAQGGSFKVGGHGGIDSQVIAMRATPGETGAIYKKGQAPGGWGGGPMVQLIDQRSNAPPVERRSENGREVFIIRDRMQSELPGLMKPILAQQYGITPMKTRR